MTETLKEELDGAETIKQAIFWREYVAKGMYRPIATECLVWRSHSLTYRRKP